jgi:hypothetical protein
MRPVVVAVVLGLVLVLGGVALADLSASRVINIGPGSFGFEPRTDTLILLEPEAGCVADPTTPPTDEVCPRRYAYAPDATLTAWVSVRNDGPFPVRLNGVSRAWLDQYPETNLLSKPVVGLDGGDPLQAAGLEVLRGTPFEPMALDPGAQRIVGVEFRTTNDLTYACEHWMDGSGVEWAFVPIAWQWLFTEHVQEIEFAEPITFMAPTASDCAS